MSEDYPHVTAILRDAGLVDATWFTEEARDRGLAVHLATEELDRGEMDWAFIRQTVSEDLPQYQRFIKEVVPRLRQYQKFLDEVKPEIVAIECPVRNEALRYQGRFDRLVRIGAREGILDIKPPSKAPWHGVQLAMYAACLKRALARWTLHLSDERYQLIEHRGRLDWECAKACLTLAAWRAEHGC